MNKIFPNGSGTLNVSSTGANKHAIHVNAGLEIVGVTVNASTNGSSAYCVYVMNDDFKMESGALKLSTRR